MAVAITNGAADILAKSLALELGPIRGKAISPWCDRHRRLGRPRRTGEKADYFADSFPPGTPSDESEQSTPSHRGVRSP